VRLLEPGLREQFRLASVEDWAPGGDRLTCFYVAPDGKTGLFLAVVDRVAGVAREVKLLELPGESASRSRWSPDGKHLAFEAITDGTWDLWVAAADGKDARRLTSDPGGERSAAWSPDGTALYFLKDYRSIWRLPMGADARPTGPAKPWALFPKTTIADGGLAFSKDRAVVAVTEEASELWLVEFPPR
jgi:dipeptidyl aminopeptidase/acylaminoacyl peptidase